MKSKIELIINGYRYLNLPAQGISIKLQRNEFNLLTTNKAASRPLHITQAFELPLEGNESIFRLMQGENKVAQLIYNDVLLMYGNIVEYSINNEQKTIQVSIVSRFKEVVDFMGDNVLYLDSMNLSELNFTVPMLFPTLEIDLLKWGYYNPMDTNTGSIALSWSNISTYCKPSMSILGYFKRMFEQLGWKANWEVLNEDIQKLVLLPTLAYTCSSFFFQIRNLTLTIPANGSVSLPLIAENISFNYNGDSVAFQAGNKIQVRYPNRLQSFKMRVQYECDDPLFFVLQEEGRPEQLIYVQSLGDKVLNQVTDSVNTKEGLNPLVASVENPNNYPITVKINDFQFLNLFRIYETNQDDFISPAGLAYSIADNYPKITALDLYREMLVLFQVAQRTNDVEKTVEFYSINDIFNKQQEVIDLKKYMFWNGYDTIGTPEGLSKINVIRYKGDTRRQQYFKTNLPQLPSNGVYMDSIFAHGEMNNAWNALTLPALKYKVKKVNDLSVEYLDWNDIEPLLGIYDRDVIIPVPGTGTGRVWIDGKEHTFTAPGTWDFTMTNKWSEIDNIKKVRLKFDYSYSNVSTGDTPETSGFGVDMLLELYSGGTYPLKLWVPLPKNKTGLSGSGTAEMVFDLIGGIRDSRDYILFKNSIVSGTNAITNFRFEQMAGLNPIQFQKITMANILKKYWTNILKFLSSTTLQNPNVFKIQARVDYYQYTRLMQQSNLFFYNGNAIMIDGEYDVMQQTFTGTFINLK